MKAAQKRGVLPIAAVAAIAVLVVAACGGDGQRTDKGIAQSIPSDASALASFQPARFLDDADVREVVKAVAARLPLGAEGRDFDLGKLKEQAKERTSVDLSKVKEVTLFTETDYLGGKGLSLDNLGKGTAVLVRGSFDRAKLLAAVEKGNGATLSTTVYKRQTLYSGKDKDTAFAILGDDLIVIGAPESVRSVVDVRAGDRPAVSGEVLKSFEEEGSPLLKFAVAVPKDALGKLLQSDQLKNRLGALGNLPLDLGAVTQVRTISYSLDKDVTQFVLQTSLVYGDKATATKASEILGGLRTLIKAFIKNEQVTALLERLQVSVKDNEVKLMAKLRALDIENLLKKGTTGGKQGQAPQGPATAS